jgi:hypothetical protein
LHGLKGIYEVKDACFACDLSDFGNGIHKATVALENVDWKKNSEYILILPPLIAPGL